MHVRNRPVADRHGYRIQREQRDDDASRINRPASTIRPTPSAPPAPTYAIPDQHNLTPELTVLEKKCYGSAGCNFRYELRLITTTPVDFAPSKRYRVTIVIEERTTWERIHSLTVVGKKADVVTGRVSSDTSTNPVATIQWITPL
ncbi:hypothetical protein ACFTS5_27445 [Nocardia sp. NPDC056952]|uniref:hypothetical protein n=1 Tax=Nocardia sp. NPDC056952 TaxID=3345979 RepID=UPI003644BFA9